MTPQDPSGVERAAEFAARDRFGRLVGYLASRFGALDEAEEALSSALASAVEHWPVTGVPKNPSAWLLTVARRRLADGARRSETAARARQHLEMLVDEAGAEAADRQFDGGDGFSDPRLKLMFVCAHPAIDRAAQAPLMLQTVLGLTAEQIASAFLVSPNAMGQRLARAKNRIREAGIPIAEPEPAVLPSRKDAVLAAIYACLTCGMTAATDSGDLTSEALWLSELAHRLLPEEPEATGLLALQLFIAARSGARMQGEEWIPLQMQNPSNWDRSLIERAEGLLKEASRAAKPGRYQTEAAIQSVHCDRRRTGQTDWSAILRLYQALDMIAPSLGSTVAQAAALMMARRTEEGWLLLESLDRKLASTYQPFWVTRAELAASRGDKESALQALSVAVGLTTDPAIRRYLLGRRRTLMP